MTNESQLYLLDNRAKNKTSLSLSTQDVTDKTDAGRK